jgi:hypothetical protein
MNPNANSNSLPPVSPVFWYTLGVLTGATITLLAMTLILAGV